MLLSPLIPLNCDRKFVFSARTETKSYEAHSDTSIYTMKYRKCLKSEHV